MHSEKVAEEKSQVLHKLLISRVTARVCGFKVQGHGDNVGNGGQDFRKHLDELLVIGVGLAGAACLQTTNLGQALQRNISELGCWQKTGSQSLDKGRLKDVAKRDPVAKGEQGLESGHDEAWLIGRVEDFLAELEDLRKLGAHGLLHASCFCRCHLLSRVVKDFF